MTRAIASLWRWVLVASVALGVSGVARAGDDYAPPPPAHVAPFLAGSEDGVLSVTGAFGPAKDTTIVVTFSMKGEGAFDGFALVPDAKAAHGQRKLPLPRLPQGSESGTFHMALTANVDKDPDDEQVIAFRVFRTAGNAKTGGYGYSTWEYAVLDWNGKKFVRLPALEKKLLAKMDAREDHKSSELSDADLRAALGLAKN
ncbi:MAG TPA: hypothetical protein VH165_25985 [Kofleriaceae bacterium]|jgi:hypothetical protein|nr:hypothetical protein [Kofleriaceae bacterium]